MKEEIFFISATELSEKIKTQELASSEITEMLIERIEKLNPIINAYCTPSFDLAREAAKNADKLIKSGDKVGQLNGIPVSIKDLTETKGIRTTFGSKIFENYTPIRDEPVAKRIRNSGAVIMGKTNTPELGFKGVTDNLIFGHTKNPWNIERTTGGSSGGAAAAIASGLCYLASGSDGGGSIRIPSSLCGVFGFKPTFGRVPQGAMKLFGCMGTLVHKGPIVRYVKDAALMLDVLAGYHPIDRYSLPNLAFSFFERINETPSKLRLGYSLDLGFAEVVDPEIKETILDSVDKFTELGWTVDKAKIKVKNAPRTMECLWITGFLSRLGSSLEQWEDKMDPELVLEMKAGMQLSLQEIQSAELEREVIDGTIGKLFKNYDILLTPTTSCTAFNLGTSFPEKINGIKLKNMASWIPFTYPFNFTGMPVSSIPCGWSKEGLPIGMQIISKRLEDLLVLQVSKTFE